MISAKELYNRPRVAAGYAYARPPVHERILERVQRHLGRSTRSRRALDLGCGAGRSSAALAPLSSVVVGIEPAAAMLAHRRTVAPLARFVVGQAEHLPFAAAAFDLITAAGAINYADLTLALPEARRVLARHGTFVIYDFSAGRRIAGDGRLDQWYEEFERRYPDLPGYALDISTLPFGEFGLQLTACEEFQVAVPMSVESYVAYAMSETRTELALGQGASEGDIREWCRGTLEPIFANRTHDVLFDAYSAYVRHGNPR